jgi:5-formyltetrahydrofolate cyclo-ligase
VTDRTLRRAKRELRTRIRAARDRLGPGERAAFGEAILGRLLAMPALEDAETVMLFSSFGSEVPTGPIIERLDAEGHAIALPRVEAGELAVVAYRPGEPMRAARFGAMEPAGDRLVEPAALDLILTPGLAFDPRGHRVGYGGGFFDRLFRRTRGDALRLGVAFELQVVDAVPHGPGDERVDGVVTERRTVWAQPPRPR